MIKAIREQKLQGAWISIPRCLGRWINEHHTDGGQAFRGNGKLTLEQDDVVQDICIQLHNTRYQLARWVRPMG